MRDLTKLQAHLVVPSDPEITRRIHAGDFDSVGDEDEFLVGMARVFANKPKRYCIVSARFPENPGPEMNAILAQLKSCAKARGVSTIWASPSSHKVLEDLCKVGFQMVCARLSPSQPSGAYWLRLEV